MNKYPLSCDSLLHSDWTAGWSPVVCGSDEVLMNHCHRGFRANVLETTGLGSAQPNIERMDSLQSIVHIVHNERPTSVTGCLDLCTLGVVQTNTLGKGEASKEGFQIFFAYLKKHYTFHELGPCKVPPYAAMYLNYITSAPADQVRDLVDFLLQAITPFFTTLPTPGDNPDDILREMAALLAFTAHFSVCSKDIGLRMLDRGIVDLLVCRPIVASARLKPADVVFLETRCLLVFGCLADKCRHRLRLALHDCRDAFGTFVRRVVPRTSSAQLCLSVEIRHANMAPQICSLISPPWSLPTLLPVDEGQIMSDPWFNLIDTFKKYWIPVADDVPLVEESQPASTEIQRAAAEQIMLFAASTDGDCWDEVAKVLEETSSDVLSMYSYIIGTFLGCPTKDTWGFGEVEMPPDTQAFLRHLYLISKSCGFNLKILHPVDRFIAMTSKATHRYPDVVRSCGMSNMLALVVEVRNGAYDLDWKPTEEQVRERERELDWITYHIMALRKNMYEI